jgi:hypothetical protein
MATVVVVFVDDNEITGVVVIETVPVFVGQVVDNIVEEVKDSNNFDGVVNVDNKVEVVFDDPFDD